MTMHPAVLYHMVLSSRQPHADLLLSTEAERQVSAAPGSGSAADAGRRRLHTLVRQAEGGQGTCVLLPVCPLEPVMRLWLYVWYLGQHGFKLLQAPPFRPFSQVLNCCERCHLLGHCGGNELVERDPVLLGQLADLFVE